MDANVSSPQTNDLPRFSCATNVSEGLGATAMIERIAVALGIPVEALSQSAIQHDERTRVIAQNAEATDIFAGITDPKAREQALAYLRWIADQTSNR